MRESYISSISLDIAANKALSSENWDTDNGYVG